MNANAPARPALGDEAAFPCPANGRATPRHGATVDERRRATVPERGARCAPPGRCPGGAFSLGAGMKTPRFTLWRDPRDHSKRTGSAICAHCGGAVWLDGVIVPPANGIEQHVEGAVSPMDRRVADRPARRTSVEQASLDLKAYEFDDPLPQGIGARR